MAKPAGAACNLRCRYCYYIDKNDTLGHGFMSDRVLEAYVKAYIESRPTDAVMFTWHGGEPLLRPLSFYERALELQRKYAGGRRIDNSLQTNGTLLTDDLCRFFRDNGFLIGISIDGPAPVHDRYRLSATGQPTSADVLRAVEMLTRHGVEWNAMAVVNDVNSRDPEGFYTFFRDTLGCRYLQFAPIVERLDGQGRQLAPFMPGGEIAPYSVKPAEWGRFLNTIFDLWVRRDVGEMFVQIFDATLASRVGVAPGTCVFGETCGHSPVMEHNGDIFTCDHFAWPEHRLGNIMDTPLISMVMSEKLRRFGAAKRDSLPSKCLGCEFLHLCHGECPKNRIVPTSEPGRMLNYLCEGYRAYFAHTDPYMRRMADLYSQGLPPSLVMEEWKD